MIAFFPCQMRTFFYKIVAVLCESVFWECWYSEDQSKDYIYWSYLFLQVKWSMLLFRYMLLKNLRWHISETVTDWCKFSLDFQSLRNTFHWFSVYFTYRFIFCLIYTFIEFWQKYLDLSNVYPYTATYIQSVICKQLGSKWDIEKLYVSPLSKLFDTWGNISTTLMDFEASWIL